MKNINRINKAQAGFTVVELMVSAAILAVVTSMIASFLTSSLRLNELNVARSELSSNLTLAMELLTTEIYSAGSIGVNADGNEVVCDSEYVNNTTDSAFSAFSVSEPDDTTPIPRYEFTIRYCDPYITVAGERMAQEVSYKIEADSSNNNLLTLMRSQNQLVDSVFTTNGYTPMIPGIVGLELEFQCKFTGVDCNPLTNGTGDYSDILSVTIKIAAQTTFESKDAYQDTYTFGLEGDTDAPTLDAEEGHIYEYAEQTVRPVNLTMTILPAPTFTP